MALSLGELTVPRIAAGGVAVTPAQTYGSYLATHGVFALSFGEWIQVLGAIYVAYLLTKAATHGLSSLFGK